MKYMEFVSVIASVVTLIGFISIFIRLGRDKGIQEVAMKDLRKDLDLNTVNIKSLETKTNTMQIEYTKVLTSLASDLGWIKSSLADIKAEIKKGENNA